MSGPSRRHHGAGSSAGKTRGAPRPAPHVETLRVESLAAGGDGVARLASGAAVFIPGTAPGEVIEAEVHAGTRPARGKLLRVVEASPERLTPPCSFIGACGGCDWMHLSPAAQRDAHAEIVRSALRHATSGSSLPEVRSHAPPAALTYRTRARLFARAEGKRVSVGYRVAGSHAIAAVDACAVLDASIAPVVGELPALVQGATGEGDILIARGAEGRPVVELHWRGDLAPATWTRIDERIAAGAWAGARVRLEGVARPASFGDPRAWMEGADGKPLMITPGGFAQTSDAGAALLARRVAELARLDRPETPEQPRGVADGSRPLHTLELFSGSGTLSILLARQAASFTAVESDAEATACARQNLAERGLSGKLLVADADAFPIPARTELVVLDPPRAGAVGASRAIATAGPRVVVYVSCDPATCARDVGTLTRAGYILTDVETFELFPQTSHVETVVRLVRARGAGSTSA